MERRTPTFIDVLDRVLDKGIVIDFDIDVSVAGLRAIGCTGSVTVMSIERYTGYASAATGPELIPRVEGFLRQLREGESAP